MLQESEEIVISCCNPEPIGGRNKTQFFPLVFTSITSVMPVLCRGSHCLSAPCSSLLLETFSLEISHA